ncbi:MAG: shikimate dehydrogenase, partial [Clostridia bacterium]|nr:shikimate dehydrogenase [Clostridia bacterium]
MEYGLIGEKLTHSFSKEIHAALAGYDYTLREVSRDELDAFLTKRDFRGINVTIPYKKDVIKHLDYIDNAAAGIGAVNTVVNNGGKLYGYNTDAFGLTALIEKTGVSPTGEKALILGGGGTSATANYVLKQMGASSVLRVSRTAKPGFITYDEAKAKHRDAAIIINTTPVGMFPDIGKTPIDLNGFCGLKAVIDAVYNPLNSRLVTLARGMGVAAEGGLYMLCMQAYMAARLFSGRDIDINKAQEVYNALLGQK